MTYLPGPYNIQLIGEQPVAHNLEEEDVTFVLGVDIGGTFTDATAINTRSGEMYTAKAASTPNDLVAGLWEALTLLSGDIGVSLSELLQRTTKFSHGTTQTTNVVFTWQGAKTALITTRGFADELHIMRAIGRVEGLSLNERRHLSRTQKPPQIIPTELIHEVTERVDSLGRVLVAIDPAEVHGIVDELVRDGVESVAVSLLWSPRNPEHERVIARIVKERAPHLHVTMAHELAPVLGEYERTSTAAINAFVAPTMESYLKRLEARLRDSGLTSPLLVLQASGGVVRSQEAVAVHTVESGPAAGLVASADLAEELDLQNVIATDVGGTTFKVGLVVDGKVRVAQRTVINQYSLLMPMVDLVSIGAGGGSIAWSDGGRLRIGPQSAGSSPGPACYGWGGTEPTVTDADAVLGFLTPENFLGGRLPLHVDKAREAFEPLANSLFGGDVVRAAAGVRTVVDAQMGNLVRKATIERGLDPRDFTLFAYGGAGPLHAASYAGDLGVQAIVVPRAATVFSAYGAAVSDMTTTRFASARPDLIDDHVALQETLDALRLEAASFVKDQEPRINEVLCTYWVDMRYKRQLHDVRVEFELDNIEEIVGDFMYRRFVEAYRTLYGVAALLDGHEVEVLRLGVNARGVLQSSPTAQSGHGVRDTPDSPVTSRRVYWPEVSDWVDTAVYGADSLTHGQAVHGPALVERPGTTIAVPPQHEGRMDPAGDFIIRTKAEAGK